MATRQVTNRLRVLILAILPHRILIIKFSRVLVKSTNIICTCDCPTSVFYRTHIWLVNSWHIIHILRRFFNVEFMLSIWFRYWYPSLFNIWGGVARNLMTSYGTCYQTLMLTANPSVSNWSVHICVHVRDNIALIHWTHVQVVAGTLLPIVILYYDSLIRCQVSLRVLFWAQKRSTAIR
jgi:hypothetical protein